MKLGFIGTGAITDAIIRGLINHGNYAKTICISKRGATRSAELAKLFSRVTIYEDNQQLVDACDHIVLAVLPEQTIVLTEQLEFRADHTILGLASSIMVDALKKAAKPATNIYRAIPMPPIEHGLGPTPVFPPNDKIESLFNTVGIGIPVEREEHFTVFAAASGFMAPLFELMATNARWMESKGVAKKTAAQYFTGVTHALASLARMSDENQLQKLGQECQTTGGLNEQTFNGCKSAGWFEVMPEQLDALVTRLGNA